LTQVQNIRPEDIERESFRIIEQEFFSRTGRRQEEFSDREFAILQRVIHATGDFSLADSIRFHPQAIDRGLAAIRAWLEASDPASVVRRLLDAVEKGTG